MSTESSPPPPVITTSPVAMLVGQVTEVFDSSDLAAFAGG